MRSLLAVVAGACVAGAAGCGGCVDEGAGPQPKRIDPGYVPKHLLQRAPVIANRVDVELGGRAPVVVYLGNNVDRTRLIPGQPFKVTHYWKVIAPPGPGWQVFTFLRGAAHTPDFMNLPATDMQRGHSPATWKAGEIIEDEQEIYLRPDWRSPEATLYAGLIQIGAHGVGDRMAASGPKVKDRAVIAHVFEVDTSKAPPPPGTVHVPYAMGEIAIDGAAGDLGWSNAAKSADFVTAEGSPEPPGKATAKLSWDDQHLYVYANIVDPDIFSEFKNQDDPLWKQDCVELFIDADNNRRGYVELQVNPNNATFDSWFPQGRAAKGDEAWDSGMITAVKVRTTPDVAGDADQGWEVEIAIPWAAVKGRDDAMRVTLPPQVGDRWRMNLVRVDKRSGSNNPAASSWNRITYADWHGLDRMLTVVFADVNGGVAPGTVPRPVPPTATDETGTGEPGAGSAVEPGAGSGSAAGSGAGSGAGNGSAAGSAAPAGVAPSPGAGSAMRPPRVFERVDAQRNMLRQGAGSAAPTAGSAVPAAGRAVPAAGSAGSAAPAAGSSGP